MVIGLGRFGIALAATLEERGHEVLAIDADPVVVDRYRDLLTYVTAADATDITTLRQLGIEEISHAVVSIGTSIEASVLTTAALSDLGVGDIWAKALSTEHARILERVGAHHVVFPERDMGRRVAHLVTGEAVDFIAIDPDYVIIETRAPNVLVGKTLGETQIRAEYDVTIVSVKHRGGRFSYATASTMVEPGDLLLVAGTPDKAEAFAGLEKRPEAKAAPARPAAGGA
jgi:trk system potassium uptake protein TrkA